MDEESRVAASLLANASQWHSIPDVARRLLELTRFDDYDMQAVAVCVTQDPALAAKLLQLTNSVQFSLYRPVASVQHALALLGRRSLRLTALTFGLIGSLTEGVNKQFVDEYWRRAAAMAVAARNLAQLADDVDPHEAYTAGLLADLGTLALAQSFGEAYARMCELEPHSDRTPESERERFGCGHPALAACLLESWNVPAELIAAVRGHHASKDAACGLVLVVRLAQRLADVLLRFASAEDVLEVRQQLSRAYSLDVDGFIDLCSAVQTQLEREWDAYGAAAAPPGVDCQKLLQAARQQYELAALDAALDLDSLVEPFEVPEL